MSDKKHLYGLEALCREHLEHVREFLLWRDQRNAGLLLTMDDGTSISYDLSVGQEPGFLYRRALDALVKVHMLWSGQTFTLREEVNCFVWRRV